MPSKRASITSKKAANLKKKNSAKAGAPTGPEALVKRTTKKGIKNPEQDSKGESAVVETMQPS